MVAVIANEEIALLQILDAFVAETAERLEQAAFQSDVVQLCLPFRRRCGLSENPDQMIARSNAVMIAAKSLRHSTKRGVAWPASFGKALSNTTTFVSLLSRES